MMTFQVTRKCKLYSLAHFEYGWMTFCSMFFFLVKKSKLRYCVFTSFFVHGSDEEDDLLNEIPVPTPDMVHAQFPTAEKVLAELQAQHPPSQLRYSILTLIYYLTMLSFDVLTSSLAFLCCKHISTDTKCFK